MIRPVGAGTRIDDAVSEICRRLDDLPLALELAAARVKALSTTQILERLEQRLPLLTSGARDLPERQRTLRGTIEWSYELLLPEERRLFARLAVFRGGCTLDDAEAIVEADVDKLQSLVDKSLLRYARSDTRCWRPSVNTRLSTSAALMKRRSYATVTHNASSPWPRRQNRIFRLRGGSGSIGWKPSMTICERRSSGWGCRARRNRRCGLGARLLAFG
jgi:hypothetical protein